MKSDVKNDFPFFDIDRAIDEKRVIITCGTGGVGKTTLSAAIALRAAIRGKKAVVVTIDPAKRLATSLGIGALGDEPTDLTPHLIEAFRKSKSSSGTIKGTVHAIMPDTRKTFERLVQDLGFSDAGAKRIQQNPIFQIFAREFSGTNEYMAMQLLSRLHREGTYDCIILDTPPSRNTLDFLDSPKLLVRFYEEKVFQWLIAPANRLAAGGMRKALSVLEKLTGSNFITHLVGFVASMFEVQEVFLSKLAEVSALLESKQTSFILVASPTPENTREIEHFMGAIEKHRFHLQGLILNRTLGYLVLAPETVPSDASWQKASEVFQSLQKREKRAVIEMGSRRQVPPTLFLPELARDVHSVEDLLYVALALDHHPDHLESHFASG